MDGEESIESVHPPSLEQHQSLVSSTLHTDPDVLLTKHQDVDAVRQRMQEQRQRLQEKYKLDTALRLEMKEKEEKMREERIAESEHKKSDGGYTVKPKVKSSASASASSSSSNASTGAKGKSTTKPRLRPEYNPLTGDTGAGSSCRWRPSRRGPSGGG